MDCRHCLSQYFHLRSGCQVLGFKPPWSMSRCLDDMVCHGWFQLGH
ncbi:hypothetical protein FOPG_20228 [Fusarium oxysporum f. sp. conglutinans race 2 54008]|uniref:Uncharacterized protein n=1 Tax=Fusarium oxysporum f. sp. conglutinans race 2 54008 TaxID=1089457 RepID=X0GJL5_FUSOX|nr:hypothetical protein FOPG_20228 [Fusarium oxysporum f. sp. conglutinans race 2 54008]